jgi:putative cell wall-binding protein
MRAGRRGAKASGKAVVSGGRGAAASLAVVVALVVGVPPGGADRSLADDALVARAAGAERIATAVAVSEGFWEASEHVVLATAADFPDALAGGALAGRLGAPLLLTAPGSLPEAVANELTRLAATTVSILGGVAAVSAVVESELVAAGYAVRRLGGSDRFATARAIASEVGVISGEAVVALGAHVDPGRGWPDALAAGAFARTGLPPPVLLTLGDTLPTATEAALADLGAASVVLMGGPGAVAPAVQARLESLGYAVRRAAGRDRYATSVAAVTEGLVRVPATCAPAPVVMATGERFPDALTATALAARLGGVLLLVPAADLDLTPHVRAFLRANAGRLAPAVVVGGGAAISDRVADQVRADLTPAADARGSHTVRSSDGSAVLEVHPGSVSDADLTRISVTRVTDPSDVPVRYRGTVAEFGDEPDPDVSVPPVAAWRLAPDGLTFAEPACLTVTVDDVPGSFAYLLSSGDDLTLVDVLDASVGAGGMVVHELAVGHFSDLSLLPEGEPLTATMTSPEPLEAFPLGATFDWALEVTVHDRVTMYDGTDRNNPNIRRRLYAQVSFTGAWTLFSSPLRWMDAVSGGAVIRPQIISTSTFRAEGQATCGDLPGFGSAFYRGTASNLSYKIQVFGVDPFGNTGALFAEDLRFPVKDLVEFDDPHDVECTDEAPARRTTAQAVQVHPDGFEQVTDGWVSVMQAREWLVTGSRFEVYFGTLEGQSVVFFLIYGPAGSIPSSDAIDEQTALSFAEVFVDNLTEGGAGGPVVDWQAVFDALGADPDEVCGGRVVLDIDADRGGRLPGFDPEGELSGSGQFTGQAGQCVDFPITLRATVTDI